MTVYTVEEPFRAKTGEIRKGQVIAMPEDKADRLLKAGKIAEVKPCPNCNEYAWWLSIHGVLVCGVCHPPVSGTVKKWISDPDTLTRMKAARPAVVLSWEEIRQRKVSHEGR
jgi:ssDNA-binding Zn-finger/Zn-ribbon topoisomerase 1